MVTTQGRIFGSLCKGRPGLRAYLLISTLSISWLASCALVEGDDAGECSDAADNDRDGWFDCDDPDCADDSACDGNDPPDDDDDNDTDGPTDADGDGWDVDEDCDDGDPSVHPGAEEVCNDGVDNDCDGTGNQCRLAGSLGPADAGAVILGAAAHDEAGFAVAAAGDLDGDGTTDLLVGATRVVEPQHSGGGAVYVLYGPLAGEVDLGSTEVVLSGEGDEDLAGYCVSGGGDVDGDGAPDFAIGAPTNGEDEEGNEAGAVYLYYGPVDTSQPLSTADARLRGKGESDWAGSSVDLRGDADGDGYDDVLVGAAVADGGGWDSGAAFLVLGPAYGGVDLGDADGIYDGVDSVDLAGGAVAFAGDTNGDGYDDMLIGAVGANTEVGGDEVGTGAAYLVLGPGLGEYSLASADAQLGGEALWDLAGHAVAAAGDTDGDGFADILVGAPAESSYEPQAGAAYLLHGPVEGTLSLAAADAKMSGPRSGQFAGSAVASAGDVDGDGWLDVLIGASAEVSGNGAGEAYLLYGPLWGDVDLGSADMVFSAGSPGDHLGYSVSAAGDVNGDAHGDIAIGAPLSNVAAGDAGAVYLLFGLGP